MRKTSRETTPEELEIRAATVRRWKTRGAAAVAVLTPLVVMWMQVSDAKDKADHTDDKAESGYQVVVKAVEELQGIASKSSDWSKAIDKVVLELQERNKSLEARTIRLEAYVEMLTARSGVPRGLADNARFQDPEAYVRDYTKTAKAPESTPTAEVPPDLDTAQQAAE